jgi:hypothetical protein
MTLDNTLIVDVDTPGGPGILEKVYLTELGLVMAKVFFPKKEHWINYPLTDITNKNITIKPEDVRKRRRERVK